MADNDFNIKITLDKNSVSQIKAEAQRMSKQLQDINKQKTNQEQEDAKLLKRVRSRLLSQLVDEEKKAAKEKVRLLKEIKEAERLANRQSLEDAKVTARSKQRELERLFPKEEKGMSVFQGLEVGENVATIATGIGLAITAVRQFAMEVYNLAKVGAEVEVLRKHFEKVSGSVEQANADIELLRTAVSGNLNTQEILMYSNRMRELGLTTNETAQILDMAERITDTMGGTIEEAQAKLLRFIETGKGRGFEQFGIDIGKVNAKAEELARVMGTTTLAMDDDEKSALRLKATMQLHGDTIENIRKKQIDLDDKLVAAEKNFDNLKSTLGLVLAQGLEPTVNALNAVTGAMDGTSKATKILDDTLRAMSNNVIGYADYFNVFLSPLSSLYQLLSEKLPQAIDKFTDAVGNIFKALSSSVPNTLFSGIFSGMSKVIDKVREMLGWLNKIPGVSIDTSTPEIQSKSIDYKKGDFYTREGEYKSGWGDFYSSSTSSDSGRSGKSGRGGKSPIRQETEEIIQLAKAMKDLKVAYEQTTERAQTFIEPMGMSAYSKLRPADQFSGAQSPVGRTMEEIINSIAEPFKEVTSSISNVFSDLMSMLNLETNSFVGRLVSGFDTVLSIVNMVVNTLNAVNAVKGLIGAIASIIPGGGLIANAATAMGGTPGGMPMSMLQSGSSRPIVNVVVQSEVEKVKAIKFFDNNFNAYQNYLRANSY